MTILYSFPNETIPVNNNNHMAANIRVAVRVRPFTEAEQAQHYQNNLIEVDRRSKQIKVAV